MRRTVWTGAATLAATALTASALMAANQPIRTAQSTAGKFTVTSTNISPGGKIADAQVYNSFGCKGGNVSPELSWSSAPAGTKSFAILMHDPDAPTGSGWWHWVVYNIPADVKSLPAGAGSADNSALPKGATQGNTDFGTPAYGGPCPPAGSGDHHYNFMLFALKVEKLDLPA